MLYSKTLLNEHLKNMNSQLSEQLNNHVLPPDIYVLKAHIESIITLNDLRPVDYHLKEIFELFNQIQLFSEKTIYNSFFKYSQEIIKKIISKTKDSYLQSVKQNLQNHNDPEYFNHYYAIEDSLNKNHFRYDLLQHDHETISELASDLAYTYLLNDGRPRTLLDDMTNDELIDAMNWKIVEVSREIFDFLETYSTSTHVKSNLSNYVDISGFGYST